MLYIATRDRGGRDDVMRKSPIGREITNCKRLNCLTDECVSDHSERIRSIQIDKNFITQTFRIYNFIISRTVRNLPSVPYRPTDDEVVYSKRLGNKVLVDLNRSNPLTVI